jgi:hypothetical protein
MSVQTEIDRIITAVGAAYDAVEAKGGTAPAAQTIEGLAGAISGIKSAPTTPYMEAEYGVGEDTDGITNHYIKRAKLYNHTAIYAYEFAGQNQLKNLDFSDASNNITAIEAMAFNQAQVNGLVLPNTISVLGNGCFNSAYITTLTVPPLVTVLPNNAFFIIQPLYNNETGEELPINIILPQNLTKIGISCFDGASIKQIAIPDTVTEIRDGAFNYCEQLASIALPSGLQKISSRMLADCRSLTSISIPASVTEIASQAFASSGLTSITIPSTVTTLGSSAFYNCESLAHIDIQAHVIEIPEGFAEESGRTSVTLPDTVETIGRSAFISSRARLTEITIPASVTSIGDYAFAQNVSMATVTCLATTPPTLGRDVFALSTASVIKVPAASVAAYKAADGWKDYASCIVAM